MKKLTYAITLLFLYPISLLPFPLLYLLSDFLRFILFRILHYRRKVVQTNLKKAFPHKTKKEIQTIEKAFYKNLCDILVETIKSLTISKKEIQKRCKIMDGEILEEYRKKNQSAIAVLGHYGNWEWAALSSALTVKQKMVVVYKKLSNPHFDQLIKKTRARFGVTMVEMKDTARFYIKNKNKTFVNCLVSDQSPSNTKTAIWVDFLNQDTAVLPGAEKLAKKFGHPLIFVRLTRIKRGYYTINMTKLTETPQNTSPSEITKLHTQALEQQIIQNPANWLWSHKRWKKTRQIGPHKG